ncbi:MAG TPA: hypothetical protein DCY80_20190 [Solibacterales bacterium]|nr:hypothetical protein [Bryobacterales bacterium]
MNESEAADPVPCQYREIQVPSRTPALRSLPAPPGIGQEFHLLDVAGMILRRWWMVLAAGLLGMLAGFGVSVLQEPVYRGQASIESEKLNKDFLNLRSMLPEGEAAPGAEDTSLRTQAALLRDEGLLADVIHEEGLATHPDFAPPAGWRKTLLTRSRLMSEAELEPEVYALRRLGRSLQVDAPGPGSIIFVSLESHDAAAAARIVNRLVGLFLERQTKARLDAIRRTESVLLDRIKDLESRLKASEIELQAYAQRSEMVYSNRSTTTAEERLSQLESQLVAAQVERVAREAERDASLASIATVKRVAEDPVVVELQSRLHALGAQQAELLTLYQPEYHKVRSVTDQIQSVQNSLADYLRASAKKIGQDHDIARSRERMIREAYGLQFALVSRQAMARVTYSMLEREVETNRKLYEEMLKRVKEAGIASALQASGARLLAAASVPAWPSRPNTGLNAMMGLLFGLAVGSLLAIYRDSTDARVRAPGELSMQLSMNELGAIPQSRTASPGGPGSSLQLEAVVPRRAWSGSGAGLLPTLNAPDLEFGEAIRGVVHSLLAANRTTGARVVLITSPSPGEGKSLVSVSLAVALAETDRTVLLVDGDLRRPQLHEYLDVPNIWGLSDLLSERSQLSNAPREMLGRPTGMERLWLLPSGPGVENVSRLLESRRLQQFAEGAARQFDLVVIDSPAALRFADYRALGLVCHGALLVLSASQTAFSDIAEVRDRLHGDGVPVLGALLNRWNPRQRGRGYGYRYYYPSGKL